MGRLAWVVAAMAIGCAEPPRGDAGIDSGVSPRCSESLPDASGLPVGATCSVNARCTDGVLCAMGTGTFGICRGSCEFSGECPTNLNSVCVAGACYLPCGAGPHTYPSGDPYDGSVPNCGPGSVCVALPESAARGEFCQPLNCPSR